MAKGQDSLLLFSDCTEEQFMKNQELRSSLIKSGILLLVCVFFIYAFAVKDSGGVVGTIGSLFSGLMSGVIFLIGLILALAFSVAAMIGIYFGILALYNQEVCKKSWEEFKGFFPVPCRV